jgi:hypothetical protein
MDNLIICDRCGSDACYVDEVNQDIKTYFCYGCGFQTNSLMVEDGEFLTQQKEILPELYKDLFHKDEKGKVWMPSAINLHEKGMIFANGASAFDWHWSAVKSVPVKEEEKHKYPNPKKPGEHYKFRMDMDTIKNFSEKEFMDALEYIGIFEV